MVNGSYAYFGKQADCLESIILMLLHKEGGHHLKYAECLTIRPFVHRWPIKNPKMWFSSAISPWDGLIQAINLLEIDTEIITSCELNNDRLAETLIRLLSYGPVVVGPLSRIKIWDRIQDHYYSGSAYFVLITEVKSNNCIVVQDPEGCPNFVLPVDKLIKSFDVLPEKTGFVAVKPSRIDIKDVNLLIRTLKICISARKNLNNSAQELFELVKYIENTGLKSSEIGSLHFGIPEFSLSIWKIHYFIRYINTFVSSIYLNRVMVILEEYLLDCAEASYALRNNNQPMLLQALMKFIHQEKLLDDIFFSDPMELLFGR